MFLRERVELCTSNIHRSKARRLTSNLIWVTLFLDDRFGFSRNVCDVHCINMTTVSRWFCTFSASTVSCMSHTVLVNPDCLSDNNATYIKLLVWLPALERCVLFLCVFTGSHKSSFENLLFQWKYLAFTLIFNCNFPQALLFVLIYLDRSRLIWCVFAEAFQWGIARTDWAFGSDAIRKKTLAPFFWTAVYISCRTF